jgi:hypothetical protein
LPCRGACRCEAHPQIEIGSRRYIRAVATCSKLLGHVPKERRQLSTWQHVEATLQDCVAGDDPVNVSVALQIVLQAERVPYR